jgi:hypothetical protein
MLERARIYPNRPAPCEGCRALARELVEFGSPFPAERRYAPGAAIRVCAACAKRVEELPEHTSCAALYGAFTD